MNTNLKKRLVALLVCALMLLNFTSLVAFSVSPSVSAKLYWSIAPDGEWSGEEGAFKSEAFSPGEEITRYFKVENDGLLAFSFELSFASANEISALGELIEVYAEGERKGTLSQIINGQPLFSGKIIPEGENGSEGFYLKEAVTEITLKMPENAPAEYMNSVLGEFSVKLIAEECDYTYKTYKKFETKFVNHEKYLYRVGNKNTVALGTLFKATENAEIGNVTATVTALDGSSGVSGTFSPATDWTKSTLSFSGTGVVEIVITDDFRCEPTSLKVEVINATNLTGAASVTSSDAVLLNDAGFSTFTVSGGHTLYGNGFTLTCANDIYSDGINDSFATVNNGILDNIRIVAPNFSHSIIYNSQKTDNGNPQASAADCAFNLRNAVKMTGNSIIRDSFVSGGRAAIQIAGSINDFIVENTVVSGGAVANVFITSARSVTLKDMKYIQRPVEANVNTLGNTVMGLSIAVQSDSEGNSAPVTLEGEMVQYAWANEDYSGYVPDAMQSVISTVMSNKNYIHNITYDDNVTRESINLGIFYVPSGELFATVKTPSITDNRTDKSEVPYSWLSASALGITAYAYTYEVSNGTADKYLTEPSYVSEGYSEGEYSAVYENLPSYATFVTSYDEEKGWSSLMTVDLDNAEGRSFSFDFSKLNVIKHNKELPYTVTDSSGNAVDVSSPLVFNQADNKKYILNVTDNLLYNADGTVDTARNGISSYSFEIQTTMTSINPPEVEGTITWGDPLLVVKSLNSDWTVGIPASLEGINIKFWNKSKNDYEILNLGSITPQSKGKVNGTNNYWEYSDETAGYTFRVTSGYIHEGKKIYGMPVVVDNGGLKLYFTISGTTGYVSTSTTARTVTLSYEFTDSNGGQWTTSHTWNVTRSEYTDHQYSYSNFVSGTLNDLNSSSGDSGGSGCFAEGTPILLADGTYKNIEDLTFDDNVVVWDFFEGRYTESVPSLLLYDGHKEWDVMNLKFSDDSELRLIYEHGLYDADANEYVLINPDNIAEQVGKRFVKKSGTGNTVVELTDYSVEKENIGCYTILTAVYNNCVANGMLTVTPPPIPGFYDYFEIGEGMKYVNMDEDIAEYGLYTYDDFSDYIPYDAYIAFNGAYLKQCVEKGYFTFEDILEQISAFGIAAGEPSALSEGDEPVVVEIGGNNITAAGISFEITADNATLNEGKYTISGKECVFTLTATGTAPEGFAEITFDGDKYYSAPVKQGESLTLTVKNGKDMEISFGSSWSKSESYGIENAIYGGENILDGGEIIVSWEDGENGITARVSNTTKIGKTADIYLAIYTNEGKLLDSLKVEKNAQIEPKKEHFLESGIPMQEGYSVKVFLWTQGTVNPLLK